MSPHQTTILQRKNAYQSQESRERLSGIRTLQSQHTSRWMLGVAQNIFICGNVACTRGRTRYESGIHSSEDGCVTACSAHRSTRHLSTAFCAMVSRSAFDGISCLEEVYVNRPTHATLQDTCHVRYCKMGTRHNYLFFRDSRPFAADSSNAVRLPLYCFSLFCAARACSWAFRQASRDSRPFVVGCSLIIST